MSSDRCEDLPCQGQGGLRGRLPRPFLAGNDHDEARPGRAVVGAAPFLALGVLELTNLLLQPSLKADSSAHPTQSVLTDPTLAAHPGRSVALLIWLSVGWFLVKRGAATP